MIDVVSCLFKDPDGNLPAYSRNQYDPSWADKLYRALRRSTSHRFNFICLVDEFYGFEEPIHQAPLLNPQDGWGAIMEAFRPDIGSHRRLVLGLDTIICGNLDEILNYSGDCGLLRDPYHISTVCNGIGIFSHEQCQEFWTDWTENRAYWRGKARYGGRLSEMEFLRCKDRGGLKIDRLDEMFPYQIQSYKVHYKLYAQEHRDKAKIVYFHGRPKMHELPLDETITEHWR